MVDLDAAFGRSEVNRKTIINIKKSIKIPIQLGGGIRSQKDLKNYIDQGIDFIIISSFAVENPDLVAALSMEYAKKIYFAMDILDNKIMVKGWKDQSDLTSKNAFKRFNDTEIKGYILTDISRDGMMEGLNINLIKENLNFSQKDLIVGGGLSSYNDLEELKKIKSQKLEGVIVGKSFYVGKIYMGFNSIPKKAPFRAWN